LIRPLSAVQAQARRAGITSLLENGWIAAPGFYPILSANSKSSRLFGASSIKAAAPESEHFHPLIDARIDAHQGRCDSIPAAALRAHAPRRR
jgi:hypothetical protein